MGSASFDQNMVSLLDSTTFSNEAKVVIDFIANYYNNIEKFPVRSQAKPGYLQKLLPSAAPDGAESIEDILKDVTDRIIPGLTHWQSPNFFAYFPSNASNAGFLGEMLCAGFNIVNFCWIASPAGTELESVVMDWMGKMLKLPSSFLFSGTGGGVLHGSTCEAVICTIAAARDKALKKFGDDKITKLVVYASDQTHSTFQKGAKLVGISPSNFRVLPTSFSSGFSFSSEALHSEIQKDIELGLIPLFLCATVGTTTCGAVDPIKELGEIANKYDMWLHIDAAYGGSACICPEFRHYLDGVELADSISMNPHKWFLTNMDCCCLWVKQPRALTDSLAFTPEYLRNKASESESVIDYKDWQIGLSRRFRAIKLWTVIRRYGLVNLRSHIRSDVDMAKKFETLVRNDKRFEVVVPSRFSLVCFRLKPNDGSEGSELNRKLLDAVNLSGRAFMTHGVVGNVYVIRCAIGATLTQENHIDDLWKLIQEKAHCVLKYVEFKD